MLKLAEPLDKFAVLPVAEMLEQAPLMLSVTNAVEVRSLECTMTCDMA
jgi:hypothetical protein